MRPPKDAVPELRHSNCVSALVSFCTISFFVKLIKYPASITFASLPLLFDSVFEILAVKKCVIYVYILGLYMNKNERTAADTLHSFYPNGKYH